MKKTIITILAILLLGSLNAQQKENTPYTQKDNNPYTQIQLTCKINSKWLVETNNTEKSSGTLSLVINTETKKATTKDGTYPYDERDDLVAVGYIHYGWEIGDKYFWAEAYVLNRITGEFENDKLALYFEKGITVDDLDYIDDLSSYNLMERNYGKCEQMAPLF